VTVISITASKVWPSDGETVLFMCGKNPNSKYFQIGLRVNGLQFKKRKYLILVYNIVIMQVILVLKTGCLSFLAGQQSQLSQKRLRSQKCKYVSFSTRFAIESSECSLVGWYQNYRQTYRSLSSICILNVKRRGSCERLVTVVTSY